MINALTILAIVCFLAIAVLYSIEGELRLSLLALLIGLINGLILFD